MSKNLFPKIAKNVNTNTLVKNIIIPNLNILLLGIFVDKVAKIGINAIGSIAINIFTIFWIKISCMKLIKKFV